MEETKETKPDADTDAQTAARHEDATSSDTLSDVQETQSDPGSSQPGDSGSSSATSTPAPDGTPAPSGGGGAADGRDTGGPM
jgi:hypothetical protein